MIYPKEYGGMAWEREYIPDVQDIDPKLEQAQAENKRLKEVLSTLVSKYIANQGTDSESVQCITPGRAIPDYWQAAKAALAEGDSDDRTGSA